MTFLERLQKRQHIKAAQMVCLEHSLSQQEVIRIYYTAEVANLRKMVFNEHLHFYSVTSLHDLNKFLGLRKEVFPQISFFRYTSEEEQASGHS